MASNYDAQTRQRCLAERGQQVEDEQAANVAPRQWQALGLWGGIGALVFASLSIAFLAWFLSDSSDGMRLVFGLAFAVPAVASAYIAIRSRSGS